jgi:hemolysin activation/secretion protein
MNDRMRLGRIRAAVAVAAALAFAPGVPAQTRPQAPTGPATAAKALREAPRVRVARVRFEGNTALGDGELAGIAARYVGRTLQAEDLEELRLEVTRRYVAAGYINSGAVIPDQKVADGVLVVRIVEGRLAAAEISGEHVFQRGFLEERLLLATGTPLNVNRLQEAMQVLLQEGAIEQINSELAPGERPGEAILRTRVREAPRFSAELAAVNNRPPNVGETAGEIRLAARNSWGLNETLSASYAITKGNDEYGVSASVPVTARDTAAFVRAGRTLGAVVEAPFDRIDLASVSETTEAGVRHPWIRALDRSLVTTLSLTRSRTTTYLLGEPFPINPGSEDGRTRVTAVRPAVEWVRRDADRVFAARAALGFGLDAMGSTIHDDRRLPDSRFVTGLGQAQWIARIDGDAGQVVARADFQLASRKLPVSEQFPVGGAASVRGYRENTLIRDEGISASLEYRMRIGRLELPGMSANPADGAVQLAVFVDAGAGRASGGRSDSLASVGGGLRWSAGGGLEASVYKGLALRDEPAGGNALQDHGIHFRIAWQRRF